MIVLPPEGIARGRTLLCGFEGRRLRPYRDVRGVWTIGDGETTLLDGSPVTAATPPLTLDEDAALTARKIAREFVPAIERVLTRDLTVNQTAAVLSLTWNIGDGAFASSFVRACINRGDMHLAGTHFRDWCHIDGKLSPPLLRRRMAEMAVWDEIDPDVAQLLIHSVPPAPPGQKAGTAGHRVGLASQAPPAATADALNASELSRLGAL